MTPRMHLCRIVEFYQLLCTPPTLREADTSLYLRPFYRTLFHSTLHSTYPQVGGVSPRMHLCRIVEFYRLLCSPRSLI